jgi:hypothetical protein
MIEPVSGSVMQNEARQRLFLRKSPSDEAFFDLD